jgi:hypothetical protein
MSSNRIPRATFSLAVAAIAAIGTASAFAGTPLAAAAVRRGDDRSASRSVRAQAEQYIDYWNAIPLNADQQRVKAEALNAIKAPCCSEYSMATCCCPCNLAKSVWGLSHYLIAKKGYAAPQVKKAVLAWLESINPGGFTGNACFTGGCKRPFAKNGCGGMEATQVIVGDDVR